MPAKQTKRCTAVKGLFALAVMMSVGMPFSAKAAEKPRFITIGTAGVTGVYYPTGGAVCRLVNKGRKDHGVRCSVESTDGSRYNINAIREGDLTMGVAQSDVLRAAVLGERSFAAAGPDKQLRTVMSLHPEPLHLVVRDGAQINSFEDLRGKRVNVGNPGSGQAETVKLILAHLGWTEQDFGQATRYNSTEQGTYLCDGKLDAMFFTAGIPSGSIKEATTLCRAKLVPIDGAWVDDFIAAYPSYARAKIPGGTYRNNPNDINSFGPKATLLTSAAVPDKVIRAVVSSVFQQFDQFRKLHPAFGDLKKSNMVAVGTVPPLHREAEAYYREQGYLK